MTTQPDREDQQEQGGQIVPFPGAQPPPGEQEVIEAEIVDDAQAAAVSVNPPTTPAPLPWLAGVPVVRPVVPSWLADAQTRREAAAWMRRYACHWAKYHTVRVPLYALRTGFYALRGVWVLTDRTWSYVAFTDVRPLELSAVRRDNLDQYLQVARVRSEGVRFRRIGVAAGLLSLAAAVVALGFAPLAVQLVAAAMAVLGLAGVGRPADRPILGRAVVIPQAPKVTDEIVLSGLAACGVNRKKVTFTAPIQRDGPGWRAEVELPHSDIASEIIAKRPKLAGGCGASWAVSGPNHCPMATPGNSSSGWETRTWPNQHKSPGRSSNRVRSICSHLSPTPLTSADAGSSSRLCSRRV